MLPELPARSRIRVARGGRYVGRAEIEVVDGTFGDALAIARDRLERRLVDAFVSAEPNASILRACAFEGAGGGDPSSAASA